MNDFELYRRCGAFNRSIIPIPVSVISDPVDTNSTRASRSCIPRISRITSVPLVLLRRIY